MSDTREAAETLTEPKTGERMWPIVPKPMQYPAPPPMSPVMHALWLLQMEARQRYLADPSSPEHWLWHYDPDTGHHDCDCEER